MARFVAIALKVRWWLVSLTCCTWKQKLLLLSLERLTLIVDYKHQVEGLKCLLEA